MDVIETEQWLFVLNTEDNGQVIAYAIDQASAESKPRVIFKENKFGAGVKLTSASFSLIKSEASQNISAADALKFVVAVACYDHCQIKVLQLTFRDEKFTFGPV